MWTTEDRAEYDAGKFYTRATDTKGFSSTIRVAIPPEVMGRILDLCERVPQYKGSRDFARDAIVHRLHYLAEAGVTSPEIVQWLREERLQATIDVTNHQRIAREKIVSSADEALRELSRAGDHDARAAMLEDLDDYARTLPPYWAAQLRNTIRAHRSTGTGGSTAARED
jgi:hypothetical protein